jgi:Flp pilus assembly protein TadG
MNRTKMTARAASNLPSALRRFARDRDGVSATEFALILPLMLTLYIGSVELGDGIAINFKTTLAARTVADVAAQCGVCTVNNTGNNGTIDATNMQSILNSSATVLAPYNQAPYSASNVIITLSELKVSPNQTQGTVQWSCSLNGTPRPPSSTVTIPNNTQLNQLATDAYVLYSEASYPYTPSMGYVISGTIWLNQSAMFFPRLTPNITAPKSTELALCKNVTG